MLQLGTTDHATPCPSCGTGMLLAAVVPCATNDRMERHTFVCGRCNQTRTYIVPTK
jgi:ribosomal protein S27AE